MNISIKRCIVAALSLPVALSTISATAQNTGTIEASKQRVVDRWTATRRASAIPRDLVIDSRGLGYMRRPDGTLQSYGHQISATAPNNPTPMIGRPSSNKDTTPPDISGMSPSDGATIGAAQMFSAVVTDASGVKSVTFNLQSQLGATESFPGSSSDGVNWSVTLQGFADLEQ